MRTSLEPVRSLCDAIEKGDRQAVERLIAEGVDLNQRYRGTAALILAARHGRKEIVELLLDHGADIRVADENHRTPLHYAASGGLDFKESVRRVSDEDSPEDPSKASRDSFADTVRLLIARGADVNARTPGRVTPLHIAARTGNRGIAETLIDAGAYINERRKVPPAEKGVGTPLHWAAGSGRIQVAELLIARGADVNAATEADPVYDDFPAGGPTPLHTAVYEGQADMVKLLVAHGAEVNPTRLDGFTPLHLAVFYKETDIVRCLLDHGARLDVQDRKGRTPADITIMRGHGEIAKILAAKESPLGIHLAACAGDRDAIAAMLNRGVDVNSRNGQGDTPLLAAVKANQREMAALLIANGADVDAKDNPGASALHLAASDGYAELTQLLIDKGAILDIPYGECKPSSRFRHSRTAESVPVYETPLFVAVLDRRT
ncbi:MAG: ankyrin repeat domain-containing protein, partial [Phycisphaerales bacterium]